MNKFTVTVDGPAGSGKDKLGELLLQSPAFQPCKMTVFNTGNLFRAAAYEAYRLGYSETNPLFKSTVLDVMRKMNYRQCVGKHLFTRQVNDLVPHVTALSEARQIFAENAMDFVNTIDTDIVVALGRITGKTALANANAKLYLETSPPVCAHRRAKEIADKGGDYQQAYDDTLTRNKKDMIAYPEIFIPASDALVINTDYLSPQEVYLQAVDGMASKFRQWQLKA